MKFSYTIPVATPLENAWEKIQDTVAMIHCIPGVEEVEQQEENHFKVTISTKLGPVKLRFRGQAEVSSFPEERKMQADVSMSDSRSGSVYGQFFMSLRPREGAEEAETELLITSDMAIAGKLGEFAQPLIKRKADQIVKEFSENLKTFIS